MVDPILEMKHGAYQYTMLQTFSKCEVKPAWCGTLTCNFTWNQILGHWNGQRYHLAILEVFNFDFGKCVQFFKTQLLLEFKV